MAFSGVDFRNLRTVELRFDRRSSGTLLMTDLAFANPRPAFSGGNLGVQVSKQTGPSLSSRCTARTGCGPIDRIQFGNLGAPMANAVVSIASPDGGPGSQTTGFTSVPTPGTTVVAISFQRVPTCANVWRQVAARG